MSGHLNEAVRKALERFEKFVQDAIGNHKTSGRALMAEAFNPDKPLIPLNAMKSASDRSEQEGFMLLTMGAMAGVRNLYSHGDRPQMSPVDAAERLAFVSMLFRRVEQAVVANALAEAVRDTLESDDGRRVTGGVRGDGSRSA